jgi:hypothetical protein
MSYKMGFKISEKGKVSEVPENIKLTSVKGEQKYIHPNQEFRSVVKKIENETLLNPLNLEEWKKSDNLNQNLTLRRTAEPKMKNEMSHWIVTKNQLRSVAPSSNTDDSFLRRWHTRFRNIVPWVDGFLCAF